MKYYKYRCDEKVYNTNKNIYYRCNNGVYRYLDNKKLCWCHYKKLTKPSIIIIQKYFRGYWSRKYTNIYLKLPHDLQNKILILINEEYYYKLYCKHIYNLIRKRYIAFNNVLNNNINNNNYTILLNNIDNIDFITIFNNNIYETYYLYNKYFDILRIIYNINMLSDIKNLYIMSSKILTKIKNIAQNYFYSANDNNMTNNMGNNMGNIMDNHLYSKLLDSILIINSLSEKYNNAFN